MRFSFGRKPGPTASTAPTPDETITGVESDIERWTAKARELEAEARSLAVTDPDASVQRDAEATACRRLIERARASLPVLYAQRFEQAIVERGKALDAAAEAEKAAVKALADRLRPLAQKAMEAISALRAIEGVPLVWGGAPPGLRGDRLLTHCIMTKDATTDTVLARIDSDLAQRLKDLDQAAGLVKSAIAYGGNVESGSIATVALCRDIIGRAGAWEAPPEAPAPVEPEPKQQESDDEMPPSMTG